MGDRALIQLRGTGGTLSPRLYLHWLGDEVGEILYDTQEQMVGRPDDVDYAFARLVQQACRRDGDGNLSIGVSNQVEALTAEDSHGDAGCFLVDVQERNWVVHAGGGYGLEKNAHGMPVWPLP